LPRSRARRSGQGRRQRASQRNEWECEIDGNRPDFKSLRGTLSDRFMGREQAQIEPLLDMAKRALRDFCAEKPFWN